MTESCDAVGYFLDINVYNYSLVTGITLTSLQHELYLSPTLGGRYDVTHQKYPLTYHLSLEKLQVPSRADVPVIVCSSPAFTQKMCVFVCLFVCVRTKKLAPR